MVDWNGWSKMTNASDIYTLYLKPHHLPAEGQQVTITGATADDLHPRVGETKKGIVLTFKGAKRKLILNQGNANRLVDIGGDDISGWVGLVILLKPEPLNKSKNTIRIYPANGTSGA